MPFRVIFINEENKQQYGGAVLTWLKADFDKQGEPSLHFWHNRERIRQAFDNCSAMVALNEKNEVVGYMIWSMGGDNTIADIDIVEVKESYRQQGIFKRMLTDLSDKFTSVAVLFASALPQAKRVFDSLNWNPVPDRNEDYWCKTIRPEPHNLDRKRCDWRFKIIRPVSQQLETLPNGRAIAVFSQADVSSSEHIDFWGVQANPNEYKHRMKYFQINVDENRKLRTPIITPYHNEGYIGIYFNRKLLVEGKASHLFENARHFTLLFVANLVGLRNPERFPKEFFTQSSQEVSAEKGEIPSSEDYSHTTAFPSSRKKDPHIDGNQSELGSEPPKKTPCHEVTKVNSKAPSTSQISASSEPSATQLLPIVAIPPLAAAPTLDLPTSQLYSANPNLLFSGGGDKGKKPEIQQHDVPQIAKP